MKKENGSIIAGSILVTSSIFASIFFKFPFWYSFYVLGSFALFGGSNYKLKADSVYSFLLKKEWKYFFLIYSVGVLLGLFIDIVYGRILANLWSYPHLNGFFNHLIPIFLYYPFGGLQVHEIFYFLKTVLGKKLSSEENGWLSEKSKDLISNFLIAFLFLGLIIPLINFYFNSNRHANAIVFVFMILTTFSFDALVYKFNKNSLLISFIQGNKLIITTMVLSWILAASLTEIPNTFSWEWRYHNIPFTAFEVFKINILIVTFGWFFLVFAPVRAIDLVKKLVSNTKARS